MSQPTTFEVRLTRDERAIIEAYRQMSHQNRIRFRRLAIRLLNQHLAHETIPDNLVAPIPSSVVQR